MNGRSARRHCCVQLEGLREAVDLRLQLAERDEDLAAARATNRELMARINIGHHNR